MICKDCGRSLIVHPEQSDIFLRCVCAAKHRGPHDLSNRAPLIIDHVSLIDDRPSDISPEATKAIKDFKDKIKELTGVDLPESTWEETAKEIGDYIDGLWLDGLMASNAVLIERYEEKQPMEWLKELPESVYAKACERFKAYPLSVDPTERKNALREAFF